MHKVLYKNGWLYLPKELIDLSEYEAIVILPWAMDSILLLSEEECDKFSEFVKNTGRDGRVLFRIIARAVWKELKDIHRRRNKIYLPKYYQEFLQINERTCIFEGNVFEKWNIRGTQIQKINLEDEE